MADTQLEENNNCDSNDSHEYIPMENQEESGEEGSALTVRDVSELLQAQFAIITGGRSREGCPIITFPDRGNFSQLSDEEYRKLIIYLTSVPSLQDADLGFVLIIDRRNDKWHSVKAVLLKISGFFPGLITVVYVLRPAGFLQKAISEVSSKIFRDEFKFRVVVCNCSADLHDHIDRNQLTIDMEGCIPYNHAEWIDQRVIQHAMALLSQAVEKFSANTQHISGALRSFTQRLQEAEFPNDVDSCEDLLTEQTTEFNELKEDLVSASRHGETLLSCIKRPGDAMQLCPDKLINVTAVERLLVQLEETDRTFHDFWCKHETKLQQCLQLRRFETTFKDIQPRLEELLTKLSTFVDMGDSVEMIDSLIAETQQFHESCLEDLQQADNLRAAGSSLIEARHCAVDSIKPKCVELARMTDDFRNIITNRLHALHKYRELHEKIDQANSWCSEGIKLLSVQPLDRFSTPELAEEALKELDNFMLSSDTCSSTLTQDLRGSFESISLPEAKALMQQVLKRIEDVTVMCDKRRQSLKKLACPRPVHVVTPEPVLPFHNPTDASFSYPITTNLTKSPKMIRKSSITSKTSEEAYSSDCSYEPEVARAKRGHVLTELLETERTYVLELCSVLKGYKDEMMNPEMQPLIPIHLYGKGDILFGNMEEIFRFHNDIFLRDLETCITTPELIGLCFVQRKDTFHHLYSLYCQNKPQSEELRRLIDHNYFFKECQHRLGHKLPLGAYLLKPVQRITKYQLLLKDLLKYMEGSQGKRELQEAVDTMLNVLKCLNDSMHQVAITGYPGNLSDLGRLLMQGAFCVWNETKKGIRDLRLKPAQRHLFLYERVLLFTKRAGKDAGRSTYHFKNELKMSVIGLTESVRGNKGDLRKFEVWLQGRQEVYTILAPTSEIKDEWVKEIKRVLLDQFEYLKGENIKQYTSRMHKGSSLNGIRMPTSPTSKHKSLRQTSSWDTGASISSSSSESGKISCDVSRRSKSSKISEINSEQLEEETSWSSEYSPSDDEDDQTFSENTECASSRFLVLADYNAMGSSEVTLREGDTVDLIKVGCAGWWYVRVAGSPYEGWAPAAYLERILKKANTSSVSSQESSSGIRPATSKSAINEVSPQEDICTATCSLTDLPNSKVYLQMYDASPQICRSAINEVSPQVDL